MNMESKDETQILSEDSVVDQVNEAEIQRQKLVLMDGVATAAIEMARKNNDRKQCFGHRMPRRVVLEPI